MNSTCSSSLLVDGLVLAHVVAVWVWLCLTKGLIIADACF